MLLWQLFAFFFLRVHQEYITAGFRETLRLYPAVSRVASPVPVDTTLTAHRVSRNHKDNQHPSEFEVKIPANSLVVIDIIGLHRNREFLSRCLQLRTF